MRNRGEKRRTFFVLTVIALCLVAPAHAIGRWASSTQERQQKPLAPQNDPRPATSAGQFPEGGQVEVSEDYRISPGDYVDIQVDRATELSGSYRVTSAGVFNMNYLGQILAKDKTQEELARLIADGLRGRYLTNPRVMVMVRPAATPAVFVQGAVRSPGAYQIQGRPSLLKLLSHAGGLDKNHGSTAFVIREIKQASREVSVTEAAPPPENVGSSTEAKGKNEPTYQLMYKANINSLYRGDLRQDALLEPADIVIIPEADVFFVSGEVHKPGSFPLREGTTLSQAISLAEGTTFKASGGYIIRDDQETGRRVEIPINLKSATKGRKDEVIRANDIIMVSSSRLKSAASLIFNGFGGQMMRVVPYRY